MILFDGECNLCDESIQFIINKYPHGHYKIVNRQSDIGAFIFIN
ncbi:DUF393 domain-containing protein [Bacillus sp. IITD106]|nr:DCC1-like thiol-disulfide oxidoreductase family protein [Lederbergia ruris]MBW8350575.1 DUF393 domain-containing protein [Bacillus sp. IITD106]